METNYEKLYEQVEEGVLGIYECRCGQKLIAETNKESYEHCPICNGTFTFGRLATAQDVKEHQEEAIRVKTELNKA